MNKEETKMLFYDLKHFSTLAFFQTRFSDVPIHIVCQFFSNRFKSNISPTFGDGIVLSSYTFCENR